jgi:hypothetical protein
MLARKIALAALRCIHSMEMFLAFKTTYLLNEKS